MAKPTQVQFSLPSLLREKIEKHRLPGESLSLAAKRLLIDSLSEQSPKILDRLNDHECRLKQLESERSP